MSLVTQCFWREKGLAVWAALVIAIAAIVAIPGPSAGAAPGWNNAETLDSGISTGTDTATNYYPIYQQHHVFNQGIESAQPVLRHGWFQPGFSTWVFETLDAGISTGTDTATVAFGDQHHLFTHGLDAGQDVLRHGWFDPAVGTWQFQTLDAGQSVGRWLSAMVSDKWGPQLHVFGSGPPTWPPGTFDYPEGSLRHGWYSETEGWQFESALDQPVSGTPSMVGGTLAWVGGDHNQNVVMSAGNPGGDCAEPCGALLHRWYDSGDFWKSELLGHGCGPTGCGLTNLGGRVSLAHNPANTNLEFFNHDPSRDTSSIDYQSIDHFFWDGSSWHFERLDEGGSSGRHNSATAYPAFSQVHVFNQGTDGSSLRHLWWNPS